MDEFVKIKTVDLQPAMRSTQPFLMTKQRLSDVGLESLDDSKKIATYRFSPGLQNDKIDIPTDSQGDAKRKSAVVYDHLSNSDAYYFTKGVNSGSSTVYSFYNKNQMTGFNNGATFSRKQTSNLESLPEHLVRGSHRQPMPLKNKLHMKK